QLFDLSGRNSCKTFRVDRLDHTAGIERTAKNFETACTEIVAHVHEFNAETAIRLITAESANGFAIRQPIERRFDVDVAGSFENRREHSFSEREDVVRCYERRFDVDLGKLRLPIGPQILVAKTFRDLKIFFDT